MAVPRRPWVAPRSGGYTPAGPYPNNPQPPKGPGAVVTKPVGSR